MARKHSNFILIILIFFFLSCQTSLPAKKERFKEKGYQPEAYIPQTSHQFKEVFEGEKISHSFTIKNKGKGALKIEKIKPA